MSKLQSDTLREAISVVMAASKENSRKFTENIELKIGLKNYDPQKDKRFSGSVKLPHIARPKMKVFMLGDAQHVEEAQKIRLEYMDVEGLKNMNKNKKLVKKLAKKYLFSIRSCHQAYSPSFGSWSQQGRLVQEQFLSYRCS